MNQLKFKLMRDFAVIAVGIIATIIVAQIGLIDFLVGEKEWMIIVSVLAGMFFVSAFTVVPASFVLVELAATGSVWQVAFFGGIGALIGDLVIFRFIKDILSEDIRQFIVVHNIDRGLRKRLASIFKFRLFRWVAMFIGALVIASPIPDEIGLAMLGFSKMKTMVFIPISFILNFIGILAICLIAQGII